jgi:hypothetical protein
MPDVNCIFRVNKKHSKLYGNPRVETQDILTA